MPSGTAHLRGADELSVDFNGVGRTGGCGRSAPGRTGSRRPGEPDGDVSRAAAAARRPGGHRARQGALQRHLQRLPRRATCAAGSWTGPNLLRSQLVLSDQHGELILPVVRGGRAERACRRCRCPTRTCRRSRSTSTACSRRSAAGHAAGRASAPPPNILVGDAAAGREVLRRRSAARCHSPTGDLQGIATRIPDAKALQNVWVVGRRRRRGAARRRRRPGRRRASRSPRR